MIFHKLGRIRVFFVVPYPEKSFTVDPTGSGPPTLLCTVLKNFPENKITKKSIIVRKNWWQKTKCNCECSGYKVIMLCKHSVHKYPFVCSSWFCELGFNQAPSFDKTWSFMESYGYKPCSDLCAYPVPKESHGYCAYCNNPLSDQVDLVIPG